MSVLIKDMEMPKSCFECPFMFARRYCRANLTLDLYQGDYDEIKGRVDGCPLVPVPDHGDLIDRDKLEKDIDKYIGGEESRSRFHHWVQVQDAVIPMDKGEEK